MTAYETCRCSMAFTRFFPFKVTSLPPDPATTAPTGVNGKMAPATSFRTAALSGCSAGTAVRVVILIALLVIAGACFMYRPAGVEGHTFLDLWSSRAASLATGARGDDLEEALRSAAMADKMVIISVVNKAYAGEDGLLDLFLGAMREGKGTEELVKHILLVAMDEIAYKRCKSLGGTQCYQLRVDAGKNLSSEQLYMSDGFIRMMWQRVRLLGDVLKLGYSFIFTDLDVMWLRNPFPKLNYTAEDLLISCDSFSGNPYNYSGELNTGFFFVVSNSKTVALFDEWYARRNSSAGMKEQDVLNVLRDRGAFRRLGMRVRVLDTARFSGFCQDTRDAGEVATVHANCCRTIRAKVADLKVVLQVARRRFNETALSWPAHTECINSWRAVKGKVAKPVPTENLAPSMFN